MPGTVLILADDDDLHARVVGARLWQDHGVKSAVWSFARFPRDERLSFALASGRGLTPCGPWLPDLDAIRSVWWRRPGNVSLSPEMTDDGVRRFARAEAELFLGGVFDALGVPIINAPRHQRAAARKPLQLHAAEAVGLTIPQTLLSNDPDQIRTFWSSLDGRVVYKAFSSPSWTALDTRRMTREDLDSLSSATLAPIIVQEEVPRAYDLRVNIFGAELFAAKVETTHPIAAVDSRFDVTAVWQPATIPPVVASKLHALMTRLKLDYGCIDMRRRPDGEYVFLEINPAGQFLFAEIDTSEPLSAAMAQLLIQGSRCGE